MKFLIAFLALIALVAATGDSTASTTTSATSTTSSTTVVNKNQDSTSPTQGAGHQDGKNEIVSSTEKGNQNNGASQIQMSALFAAVPVLVAMKFF